MATANGTNGTNGVSRPKWRNGPGVPLTTPFKDGLDEIDHEALAKQVVRCAKAGINIVLLGTTGEASHLSNEERKAATKTARKALDDAGLQDAPLMVGTGGGSVQTTLELTREAADAGASHAIVILPGYFSFAMRNDKAAILGFFKAVMDRSPLPVMIYNFPGAAGGIDMSSDDLSELADHPMCFGAKLTCGNIGKGNRIAIYTRSPEFLKRKGSFLDSVIEGGQFQLLPGFSDTLLSAMMSGHTGAITSTGALLPKTIRRLYDQGLKGLDGDYEAFKEARQLQDRIARSDGIAVSTGFQGAKHFLDHFVEQGLGGDCRLPLGKIDAATKKKVEESFKEDWEFEQSL